MNNKITIEFGFRIIRRIMWISGGCYSRGRYNSLLLHNSSDDTQPYPIIDNYQVNIALLTKREVKIAFFGVFIDRELKDVEVNK